MAQGTKYRLLWALSGALVLGYSVALLVLSRSFDISIPLLERPIGSFVTLQMAGGGLLLAAFYLLRGAPSGRRTLAGIFAVGLAARLVLVPSVPILEDDFYRYLWDGALVAHGLDPYAHSPAEIRAALATGDGGFAGYMAAAVPLESTLDRINHPDLVTIYPPVAQAAFALAYALEPGSLWAWKTVLLSFDLMTFGLLVLLLRVLGRPGHWIMLYWWNPLVLKELFNAAHMDGVLLPFLLGAALLLIQKRIWQALACLLGAVAVKIWPLLLLPLALGQGLRRPHRFGAWTVLSLLLAALLLAPLLATLGNPFSGLGQYSARWEMNGGLFVIVTWGLEALLGSQHQLDHSRIARGVVALALVILAIALVRSRGSARPLSVVQGMMLLSAALFMCSPTQYPWYYLWILPWLVVLPRLSLLLYGALLQIYYLRFELADLDLVGQFDDGWVWLQHVPVWGLLIWEFWRDRKPPVVQQLEPARA